MCVTSPPYWGLRDYGNEPQIWDELGDEYRHLKPRGCEHVWGDELPNKIQSTPKAMGGRFGDSNGIGRREKICGHATIEQSQGQFCQQCGAWRGSLGLEPTPELFIKHMVQIFSEVKRVLRNDGTLWLNMGDSYASNSGRKTEDERESDRKRADEKGYNHRGWNSSGNYKIDRAANTAVSGLKVKDLCGIPWMLAFALRADGWYLRSDIIWHKPNPMPESVTDRPTKSHEYMFLLSKSQKYFYDADAIREANKPESNKRYEYSLDGCYTPGKAYVNEKREKPQNWKLNPSGRNKRTVWTIPTHPMPEAHFATFPKKLIEPCILAGSAEGGTVLDPFFGSGTTGLVAYRHGRKFVGIELSQTYLDDIAIPRIKLETKQRKLF